MQTEHYPSPMLMFHEAMAATRLQDARDAVRHGPHTKAYSAWARADEHADAAALEYFRTKGSATKRIANRKSAARTERLALMTAMQAMMTRDRDWYPTPGIAPLRTRLFAGETA